MLLAILGYESGAAGLVAAWARELGAEVRLVTGPDELAGCHALHLPGAPPPDENALELVRAAHAAGIRVSLELPGWRELRAAGPVEFRRLLDALAPDVLFATPAEFQILGGAYLSAPLAVLRLGFRSCTVFSADIRLELAAPAGGPADAPVDEAGCAEAFAAGFLLGGSPEEAGRRALETAARCATAAGALPS
jgi:sugar/nucleoside kinase (ribokinase family)